MKNCFPCDIIQRVVNNYLCKFFNHDNLLRDVQTKKGSTLFFKLPFIGPFSSATQRRIKVITKKYCEDLDIRLVFTSYKLKNMFVVKDAVPHSLRSLVVYKFSCAGCGACYVGETARHFSTRVREHLFSDRNSHIYRHLKDSESCRNLCSEACFSILDSAPTVFQLKIKEALHIEWERPSLNKQLKHLNVSLLL